MASVILSPGVKNNLSCIYCKGKCMVMIFPGVYKACRDCIPYSPTDNKDILQEQKYMCSACRDSNVSYWATDIASPCSYCSGLKSYKY